MTKSSVKAEFIRCAAKNLTPTSILRDCPIGYCESKIAAQRRVQWKLKSLVVLQKNLTRTSILRDCPIGYCERERSGGVWISEYLKRCSIRSAVKFQDFTFYNRGVVQSDDLF